MWNFFYRFSKVANERIYIFLFLMFIGFLVLTIRLFNLQILEGDEHYVEFKESIIREVSVSAQRGYIYDKYGIPLASTKIVYNLKYDRNMKATSDELNRLLLEVIKVLRKSDRDIIDELPISMERPYKFTYTSETKVKNWLEKDIDMKVEQLPSNFDAEPAINFLKEKFEIDYPDESEHTIRRLIALRYSLYIKRYYSYLPLVVASDVNDSIVIELEEKKEVFPGLYVEAEPIRDYTSPKAFAHILGYLGKINETEYEELKSVGYTTDDMIGKTGIEKEMEKYLRGVDGKKIVEVDNLGRKISSTNVIEPINGNNIYLNIDAKFQEKVYNTVEKQLNEILISRINGSSPRGVISIGNVYNALAEGNAIVLSVLLKATSGVQKIVGERLLSNMTEEETYRQAFSRMAKSGLISYRELLQILVEQGKIVDETLVNAIGRGSWSSTQIMMECLKRQQINAEDLWLNPGAAAAVVLDVKTGKVLAMVNYPSYDSNKFIGNFDQEYYSGLINNPATPLINRALTQRKAPGSTFKMITAIAGLEEGVITSYSTIYDKSIFTEAGNLAAKCWIYPGSHGSVNVIKALEVSCNYFFYTVGYNLARSDTGRISMKAINAINKYANLFGLNSKSGIELASVEYVPQMASPEFKEKVILASNPSASQYDTRWFDGDTIRAAIGQSYNNFAPIHMAKYVATIASSGLRYTPYLIDRIEIRSSNENIKNMPKLEAKLDIKQETFDTVKKGMLNVTQGVNGTARGSFTNFNINVAAKTGTAQEGPVLEHAWFVGFAPYEDPQIAVVTFIPYNYVSTHATILAKNIINDYFTIDYSYDLMYNDNILMK